jgi:dTDP-4-dehydrorhamnose reductase
VRILLFGGSGQVGWELRRCLAPLGAVHSPARQAVPLEDAAAINRLLDTLRPDAIVNAAAYTAVDAAEAEPSAVHAINAAAPGIMAQAAARHGSLLIHYSSDYVFDGRSDRPYEEADETAPLGVYGRSKLAGEEAILAAGGPHLIVRTSWVYGLRGSNFLKTVIRLGAERPELRVVGDQIGAPTWSRLVAEATAQLLIATRGRHADLAHTYHLCCAGETSWHGFAEAILAHWYGAAAPPVRAITTAAYGAAAPRPLNSRLSCDRLETDFGIRLPHWETALDLVREESAV